MQEYYFLMLCLTIDLKRADYSSNSPENSLLRRHFTTLRRLYRNVGSLRRDVGSLRRNVGDLSLVGLQIRPIKSERANHLTV